MTNHVAHPTRTQEPAREPAPREPPARHLFAPRKRGEGRKPRRSPERGGCAAPRGARAPARAPSARLSDGYNNTGLAAALDCAAPARAPALLSSPPLMPPPHLAAPDLASRRAVKAQYSKYDMDAVRRDGSERARPPPSRTSGDPAIILSGCREGNNTERAAAQDCAAPAFLSSPPPILPPHLVAPDITKRLVVKARRSKCGIGAVRRGDSERAHPLPSRTSAGAPDCAAPISSSPLLMLPSHHETKPAMRARQVSSMPPPPSSLLSTLPHALSTLPSGGPAMLSNTCNKSDPAATAAPPSLPYTSSLSSAQRTRSRAVEATFCKDRRKTRGRGHRAIAPILFCCSRTLVLAVPLLVLATLASVRRPGASRRVLGGVEAEFAPRSRGELQGDGGAEKGVFGCVGACGQSLSGSSGETSCYNPGSAWHSGNGVCANANSDVPSDQGTGKYGAIESWDVSRVQSMRYSECVCVMCLLKRVFGLRCAAGVPCSPHRPRASAASARELCVSSVSISRPPPPFRVLPPLVQGVCSCDLTLSLVSFVCFFPLY